MLALSGSSIATAVLVVCVASDGHVAVESAGALCCLRWSRLRRRTLRRPPPGLVHHASPLEVLRKDKLFLAFEVAFMIYGIGFLSLQPVLPLYLVDEMHVSYTQVALARGVIFWVAMVLSSLLVGRLADKIGILRAVGTPPRRVLAIFLIQGGLLGLAGSFIGSALGVAFAKIFEAMTSGPNGLPRFPVQIDLALLVSATALATGIGLLAAVIPARRAARLDPATAIRG